MEKTKKAMSTKKLVMYAVLTAITFVLQYISMSIRTGTFSITLSLVPIVIGAALLGWKGGTWLGFVFGVAVLISGDAGPFLALSIPGTIITVLAKGALSGFVAGLIFKVLSSKNNTLALIGHFPPLIGSNFPKKQRLPKGSRCFVRFNLF